MKEWIFSLDGVSQQVMQQLLEIVVMFFGGMTIGLLRTIYLLLVKWLHPSRVTAFVEEVLFWIACGFVAAEFFYYCSYGALSAHGLLALAIGYYLWKKGFSTKIVAFLSAMYGGIIKRSAITGDVIGEHTNGESEKKPRSKKRKQRHRYRRG